MLAMMMRGSREGGEQCWSVMHGVGRRAVSSDERADSTADGEMRYARRLPQQSHAVVTRNANAPPIGCRYAPLVIGIVMEMLSSSARINTFYIGAITRMNSRHTGVGLLQSFGTTQQNCFCCQQQAQQCGHATLGEEHTSQALWRHTGLMPPSLFGRYHYSINDITRQPRCSRRRRMNIV